MFTIFLKTEHWKAAAALPDHEKSEVPRVRVPCISFSACKKYLCYKSEDNNCWCHKLLREVCVLKNLSLSAGRGEHFPLCGVFRVEKGSLHLSRIGLISDQSDHPCPVSKWPSCKIAWKKTGLSQAPSTQDQNKVTRRFSKHYFWSHY